jgi:diguanylate cyclase (GGDEF)-like protein
LYGVNGMKRQKKLEDGMMQSECFQVIAGLVTDIIFEYQIASDKMIIREKDAEIFKNPVGYENFTFWAMDYIHEEDIYAFHNFLFDMKAGLDEITAEFRWKVQEQQYKWFSIQARTLHYENGEASFVVGKIDKQLLLTIPVANYNKNQQDGLTRLLNRAYFKNSLDVYLQKYARNSGALYLIGLDDFSWINETMGKLFGNEVLVHVAKTIKNTCYHSDFCGRVGGDLFVMYLKDLTEEEVILQKAEKLRNNLSEVYTGEKRKEGVRASIGISRYPMDGTTFEDLFESAEKAFNSVKKCTKNAICLFSDSVSIGKNEKNKSYMLGYTTFGKERDIEFQDFGYELTDFAFELMEDSKDVDSVVQLLLIKVADYYGLSGIRIKALADGIRSLEYLYEYIRESDKDLLEYKLHQVEGYPEYNWLVLQQHFQDSVYLFLNHQDEPDESMLYLDDERRYYHSFVQIPLFMNKQITGYVDFIDLHEKRIWSKKDLHTLKIFSKIIASYLLNMKAYNSVKLSVLQMNETDFLTGLSKYEKFIQVVQHYLEGGTSNRIAIIYSDIRHFKYINETYGYHVGDQMLKDFCNYIMKINYNLIGMARVYSDNIIAAVYLKDAMDKETLRATIEEFNHQMENYLQRLYFDNKLSICTGIYVMEDITMELEMAISNANIARKQAKKSEKIGTVLFDESYNESLRRKLEFTSEFPKALRNKELEIYYQPKIQCGSNRIAGAEALIRWLRDGKPYVYPDQFIPALEENGMIVDLDYYVYQEVFSYLSERIYSKKPVVPISMNVSRIHLENEKLIEYIKKLFEQYQIPAELIEFELTESIYIENSDMVLPFIEQLHDMGVKVSMDDFGSGYSSLSLISKLPIDIIKLDKVFLKNVPLDEKDEILISSIVEMARKLHMSVVCEGVEHSEHSLFLCRIGCDFLQGYYFSRPIPVIEFEKFMLEHVSVKTEVIHFDFKNRLCDTTGKYCGTIVGQHVTFTDGYKEGLRALCFPGGIPGHEILELPPSVYINQNYSISMWILEEEENIWTSVLYTAFDNGFNSIIPRAFDKNVMFRIKDDKDNNGWYDAGHRRNLGLGWNYIVITYDAVNQLSLVYLNGKNAGYREASFHLFLAKRVIIGGDIFQTGFCGKIANLKFYSQTLSAFDIMNHYQEER